MEEAAGPIPASPTTLCSSSYGWQAALRMKRTKGPFLCDYVHHANVVGFGREYVDDLGFGRESDLRCLRVLGEKAIVVASAPSLSIALNREQSSRHNHHVDSPSVRPGSMWLEDTERTRCELIPAIKAYRHHSAWSGHLGNEDRLPVSPTPLDQYPRRHLVGKCDVAADYSGRLIRSELGDSLYDLVCYARGRISLHCRLRIPYANATCPDCPHLRF